MWELSKTSKAFLPGPLGQQRPRPRHRSCAPHCGGREKCIFVCPWSATKRMLQLSRVASRRVIGRQNECQCPTAVVRWLWQPRHLSTKWISSTKEPESGNLWLSGMMRSSTSCSLKNEPDSVHLLSSPPSPPPSFSKSLPNPPPHSSPAEIAHQLTPHPRRYRYPVVVVFWSCARASSQASMDLICGNRTNWRVCHRLPYSLLSSLPSVAALCGEHP